MVLKNLYIRDVFPQKHGNAHVYPHGNTKMARERNAIMFPAAMTIMLGNASVLKTCFVVFPQD